MKQSIILLITIFSLGINNLNATNLDSLLVKEYKSCRAELSHIIEKESLKESLAGHPFYAYMVGQFWMIVVNQGENTVLFLKDCESSPLVTHTFSCQIKELTGPFSLIDLDIENNKRQEETGSNPFYRYFVLFDSEGYIHFEWSSSTYCEENDRISILLGKSVTFAFTADL